jgi:hypothetical protein
MLYRLSIKWTLNSEISARHGVIQVDTSRMIRNLTFLVVPPLDYPAIGIINSIYITQHGINSITDGTHIEFQPLGDASNSFDTRLRFPDRFNLPINPSIHIQIFLLHPISERNNEAGSVINPVCPSKN